MSIAPAILKHYPELIDSQREVVGHLDGPLLVIAGPGVRQDLQHRLEGLESPVAGQGWAKEDRALHLHRESRL